MMRRFQSWATLAVLGLNAICVMADTTCVSGCIAHSRDEFQTFGCTSATDNGCLCLKQNFVNQVSACASACSATPEEVRNILIAADGFCFQFAAQLPAAAPAATPSSAPASTSTAATSTTSPSSSTSSSASTSTSQSTSTPQSTSSTSTSASTTSATSTNSAATTTSSSSSSGTTSSSHSSTSTTAAGETSPASSPAPVSGISSGAAAGIGIGVAIVVVAVAAIGFCLFKKRKAQAGPRQSLDISKPLPGSGRTYPARDHRDRDRDSFDKYGNDIEMTSNRYEDMVPSQQPRTMV